MSIAAAAGLFVAAVLGAALNAIAGGGSFLTFPTLLFTGVPPIEANATSTIALWSGVVASSGAYRERLVTPRRILWPLLIASVAGGLAGALLLLHTPQRTFMLMVPWLILAATLLFIFGNRIKMLGHGGMGHQASTAAIVLATIFEIFAASYGGFFGGGLGFVQLGMLAVLGMNDIHEMNAIKTLMGSVINIVAVVVFVVGRVIFWPQAVVMVAGGILGGWFGAHYAQKVDARHVRWAVIVIGLGLSAYFFLAYRQAP